MYGLNTKEGERIKDVMSNKDDAHDVSGVVIIRKELREEILDLCGLDEAETEPRGKKEKEGPLFGHNRVSFSLVFFFPT